MEGHKIPTSEFVSLAVKEGRKGGADDIAATCVTEDVKLIRFTNNNITVTQALRSSIISVMVAVKKRVAIGSIEDLSRSVIKNSLDYLVKVAKSTRPNRDYASLPRGPFNYTPQRLNLDSIQGSDLVGYVKTAIESALSNGAERVAGTLTFKNIETELETSSSAAGRDFLSSLETSVRVFASEEASGQANSCARSEKDFHPEQAGQAAAAIAQEALHPVEGKPGIYDVVLGPNVFANLLNDVMIAASAFNVDSGLSFMTGKLGKGVASSNLTLIDDGTLNDGLNSRAFDDEGVPTRRTIVVEKGVLRSYLHNASTAKKFKTITTANAGWIVPQPWNIVVEGGDLHEEEMLRELGDGIFITNNWYTRFQDYRSGDFSTVCRDGLFQVNDGEITQSLKGLRISDNLPRILQNIVSLSKSRQWVKWWEVEIPTLAPSVLVRNVKLTRTTK